MQNVLSLFVCSVAVILQKTRLSDAGLTSHIPRGLFTVNHEMRTSANVKHLHQSSSAAATEDYPVASICVVGDIIYEAGQPVSSGEPCLKCRCHPPKIHCDTIRCQKRPGCKAVHHFDKCCPDYQCDCGYNGEIYNDGDRIRMTPNSGSECQVCHCRGGDVQCNPVACYMRTDCEPKLVPGQCCPTYDHCPIQVSELNLTWINGSSTIENHHNEIPNSSSAPTDSSGQESNQPQQEEIRIQEIVPVVMNLPSGQLIIEEATSTVNSNNSSVGNTTDAASDARVDSSNVAQILQQPPPILRIGDRLLFLQQNGQDQQPFADDEELLLKGEESIHRPIITIFGAEGLQRGDDDNDDDLLFAAETSSAERSAHNNRPGNDVSEESLNTASSTHILSLVKRRRPKIQAATTTTTTSTTTTTTMQSPDETDDQFQINSPSANPTDLNPAYPPIPDDLFLPFGINSDGSNDDDHDDVNDDDDDHNYQRNDESLKILTDVLEVRNNNTINAAVQNKSSTQTNIDWLKNGSSLLNFEAVLPQELLNETAASDDTQEPSEENSNADIITSTHGYEVVEITDDVPEDDTGQLNPQNTTTLGPLFLPGGTVSNSHNITSEVPSESTTVVDQNVTTTSQPLFTPEVAVVPTMTIPKNTSDDELKSVGSTSTPEADSTTLVSVTTATKVGTISEEPNTENDEAEEITTTFLTTEASAVGNVTTSAVAIEQQLNRTESAHLIDSAADASDHQQVKTVLKRENGIADKHDEVFRQLTAELNGVDAIAPLRSEQEEIEESKRVFAELEAETSTKSNAQPLTPEQQSLQKVTDAIARLTLSSVSGRGRGLLDSNILGVLSDFFNTQYSQQYSRKAPSVDSRRPATVAVQHQ